MNLASRRTFHPTTPPNTSPFLNISFASLCIACSGSLKFSHSHHSLICTTIHSLNVPPNCVSLSKLSAHNPKNHLFHACQCVDDVGHSGDNAERIEPTVVKSTVQCEARTPIHPTSREYLYRFPSLHQHILGLALPCYTGGISNTEGIHVLHSLLSSYQFQATLPVAEQLISMSLVIGLNEHALCSFQASTRQVFCEGADYSGLDRVEVCILVESTPHPSFTLYFVSISAYIFCDIVRPAYVITNDTPHLLHRCMPAAHDISLSPSQHSALSSFLTLLASCSTQFTQFMSNESSLVVLAALAKIATQLHLAQPQSMFRTALKGADDIAADGGQSG
ncbi:hypothetical protein BLNAU_23517 [Blattamonas nauphoetae]|uniref:Uncharacterized protein n=1 Tax=Blattamonas nauphoetae TaxID=2049346 RepID=A0ABQ9WQ02_9EUKA|nr:hypothetical protein BLNAU_23517 [Blattamonas nauphoetae]